MRSSNELPVVCDQIADIWAGAAANNRRLRRTKREGLCPPCVILAGTVQRSADTEAQHPTALRLCRPIPRVNQTSTESGLATTSTERPRQWHRATSPGTRSVLSAALEVSAIHTTPSQGWRSLNSPGFVIDNYRAFTPPIRTLDPWRDLRLRRAQSRPGRPRRILERLVSSMATLGSGRNRRRAPLWLRPMRPGDDARAGHSPLRHVPVPGLLARLLPRSHKGRARGAARDDVGPIGTASNTEIIHQVQELR